MGINYKNHYEFPEKTFYYTTFSDNVFKPLPDTLAQHIPDMKKHSFAMLKGDPNLILENHEEAVNPDDIEAKEKENQAEENKEKQDGDLLLLDESVDQEVKPVEKRLNFTELSKLAFIVKAIDYDTNIFPKGAFKLLPIHEIRKNDTFRGLKPEELLDIRNFHYFRAITNNKRKEIIESDEAIFRFDFLDCVDEDPVNGSWSLQVDSTKEIVRFNLIVFGN